MKPCDLFQGSKTREGYGVFMRDRRNGGIYAHRFAWMMTHGEDIPEGMYVCHQCDNPSCWEAEHLFLGTPGDNTRDMIAKGRHHWAGITHCPRGHEYTPENTRYAKNKRKEKIYYTRLCRECGRADARRRRHAPGS